MRRAAVLGSPVRHSLSPLIHNAGYAAVGLTGWTYTSHECAEDGLASFVEGLGSEWAGLSLTMPLKEVALDVAGEVAETARTLGAANTLVLIGGRWVAHNTDAPGMCDALAAVGSRSAERVSVLGAGGTARAALGAAAELGATEVVVYARRRAAVAELAPVAERLGLRLEDRPWSVADEAGTADVVVSTVPKGVADDVPMGWGDETVLFDVLYDPWPTPLAESARKAGCRVVDGLALLLAQAARQFTLFTGVTAPVERMRLALRDRPAVRT